MDNTFREGVLYPWLERGAEAREVLQPPVDRVVFANRMAIEGTAIVHASAVRAHGGVLLFCGRSGIGKSTMADIWQRSGHGTLLNDDRAIVFCSRGHAHAGAAPWHGKNPHVDPATGPLKAVFHLGQSGANRLEQLAPADAAARLLATAAIPFYYELGVAAATDAAAQACSLAPSFQLDFYPDEAVMNLVDGALGHC